MLCSLLHPNLVDTQNGTLFQYFQWYTPSDGSHWRTLAQDVPHLAATGFTALWLPPASKGSGGPFDVGYGVYDLYDLGEFDQKGSVRTKYGTRDEYVQAIQTAKEAGMQVYADIVLNHRLGGDHTEVFHATPIDPANRYNALGSMHEIKAWTHFTFPGRNGQYSDFQWHWWHFDATDYNEMEPGANVVWLFDGKSFDAQVDHEFGNYDYLMGCDLDFSMPEVQEELLRWGAWFVETTGVDGFRFDAVKHVKARYFHQWLNAMRQQTGKPLFGVGEYWSGYKPDLLEFIGQTGGDVHLFDVPLHYTFARIGREGAAFDLRTVFDGSLVNKVPNLAVTKVSNHDTQPMQSLESVVEPWFVPLAYALILLRRDGYPCVFHADYYGATYEERGQRIEMASHRWMIDRFMYARKQWAYGEQNDYFDHPNCIGWVRRGSEAFPGGVAVVLSTGDYGWKTMNMPEADTTYYDITGHIQTPVRTDGAGWGTFACPGRSVSVWAPATPDLP